MSELKDIDRLISFDISSDFGMFKKPDVNDIYFSFNIIPKPTLLGVLGAIIGLGGYSQMKDSDEYPEFYNELNNLLVSIVPLKEKGVFQKRIIKYNNTIGYANKQGGTLNISEQTLVNPKYKIYLALNLDKCSHKSLYEYLVSEPIQYEYIPYMGKNEFKLDIGNVNKEINFDFNLNNDFAINSIFINNGNDALKLNEALRDPFDISMSETYFYYFERLPVGFDSLNQYRYGNFSFTNAKFNKNVEFLKNLKLIRVDEKVICLY